MIIGITGGIGSGKTRVAQFWSHYFNLPLLDLDDICKTLMEKGHPGWQVLRQRFGSRYFTQNGDLDRPAFRKALFNNQLLRKQVDSLLHPLARSSMQGSLRQMDGSVFLVEIPLLFEAGWESEVDRVVVVYADLISRRWRIVTRDNVSEVESDLAIRSQTPLEQKVMTADHVIENSGPWAESCLQIIHLGRIYT